MKVILGFLLKATCTPLIFIMGALEVLIAFLLWDNRWLDSKDYWGMLWKNKYE